MIKKKKKSKTGVFLLSLGCPKTLVDSEVILGKLDRRFFRLTLSADACDIAMINTCSFIHDAKRESIEKILELIELKKQARLSSILVLGCLVQNFPKEIQAELREVDAFVGSGNYHQIPEILKKVLEGRKMMSLGTPGYLATAAETRVSLTPLFSRYLKISEGCDHGCSFCTIPLFRGAHRSRRIPDIVCEAKRLVREGAKELILVGQDTTYFGRDFDGNYHLPELLRELDQLRGLEWIRLLYAYPNCVTDELLEVIQNSKHICHAIDLPLQHVSDSILQKMKRGITKRRTVDLIRKMRAKVKDLSLRTTLIVGFPGETERDFQELLDFIEETKFERLGVFAYSQEEGSVAAALPGQVSEAVKKERVAKAMALQQRISLELNQQKIGKLFQVLIERSAPEEKSVWIGRTYQDAPEIDQNVYVRSSKKLVPGSFYSVRITHAKEYDLMGEVNGKNT